MERQPLDGHAKDASTGQPSPGGPHALRRRTIKPEEGGTSLEVDEDQVQGVRRIRGDHPQCQGAEELGLTDNMAKHTIRRAAFGIDSLVEGN